MRTQVAIIGAGPAGLFLGHVLTRAGIDNVILERRDASRVLARIRAGVLEAGSADLLRKHGIGARMDAEGLPHDGFSLAFGGRRLRVDLRGLAGASVVVYGQTEITRDLMEARAASGARTVYGAEDVAIEGFEGDAPAVTWREGGVVRRIGCDYVCACDGFHGVGRASAPRATLREHGRAYPFGWLGVLVDAPPADHELLYARHERGFALCSMRSATRSRYYVQVPEGERAQDWSDARFFDELRRRLPDDVAERVTPAPSLEKSVAPLRSFVAEPMRFGRLFLAGDAAHIVPPTGAKGLNLALGDVHYLSEALIARIRDGDETGIDGYSAKALARVWRAERFSWRMTGLMHEFPDETPFERRMKDAEFAELEASRAARAALAENYVGAPL
ncbi:MAG: 4-hydroxybenzoate 3-monooxygenase [Hyphomicrobiales bacterium]|nr:4-hydroxybenzoate 3-monooxygenase [Hyphomicrobiales bacterium]